MSALFYSCETGGNHCEASLHVLFHPPHNIDYKTLSMASNVSADIRPRFLIRPPDNTRYNDYVYLPK